NVPFSRDTHTRVNIKKRHIKVYRKTLTTDANANISYLEAARCTPPKNLFIADRSRSLPENAFFGDEDYVLLSSRVFTTRAKRFLVTDVFVTETATQQSIPLFYAHELKYFNSDLADFSDRELLTVEFVDISTMKPFNFTDYYIDTASGKVYNNLENSYNPLSTEYAVSMVRYSVRVTVSGVATTYSYQELLNNQHAFEQATVQDLDDWGNLIAGRKVYLLESVPGSTYYRISLPPGSSFAYQETAPSKIYIREPAVTGLEDPWNVRITNGEFMSSVRNGEASYRSSKYYISEFLNQSFFPYYPYKTITEEEATLITKSILKVTRNIKYDPGNNFHIQMKIFDSSGGSVETVLTSDVTLIGTYFDSSQTTEYKGLISSVDELNGFVEIDVSVPLDRKVQVTYVTESDEYDFTLLDFNPLSNRDIEAKKIVVYVNPETPDTGTLASTLHYLEVDRLGRITYCSQADTGGIDPATTKLLTEDFNDDGSAKSTFYYDLTSTPSGLRSRTSGIFSAYREGFSFIDKYTVETTLSHIIAPSGEFVANLQENPGLLVLADIQVGESESPLNASKIDVRVRGGGIKEGNLAAAIEDEPEVRFYWDKEYAYPSRTAFMVELPESLLSDNGGDYTYDQLKEVVSRHADEGSYQVLRNYGNVDPVIVSGELTSMILSGIVISGIVQFVWTSYGDEATYDILMSTDQEQDFTVMNPFTIDDQFPTNDFTISGLIPNVTYYAYIRALKDGETSTGP
ncbi:MAG: hypothetical protein ACXABY_29925, partial [Candidatus Thorarchaeota archaeon]